MRRVGGPGLVRDRKGATIVEFGIVLLPLCLLLMGTLDAGYQMYVRVVLQGALDNIARRASVETPNISATGPTIEARIHAELLARVRRVANAAQLDVNLSSYQDFTGVGRPERLVTDVNANGRYDTGDCWVDSNPNRQFDTNSGRSGLGGAQDVVFYEARLTMPRLLPMASLAGMSRNYDITAKAAIRSQPYANQRQPDVAC